ncbi:RNA polymerase sigma factor [Anaerohalosphaera lusitana]|uniref:RNA polymerase sigma factor n=1 Tax=Anaerohalosphaera lusitana TaxID=1936003 RepID=A0A1U9NIX2_9BACT|nr:sigma-70 family RNA polymerase sigma factor [Anaerohalosphaera lusitana]AQT67674.1 RNA polymerase sigma factor [Anaerohalosphaera lusitana]
MPKQNGRKTEIFVDLLTANYHSISSFVHSQILDSSDAEDVMQETTSMLWQRFDEFEIGTNFAAWASTVARYRILEFRRQKKKNHPHLSPKTLEILSGEADHALQDTAPKLKALKKCLSELPVKDHRVIDMKYRHGIGVNSIADKFQTSASAIYRTLTRTKEVLMRCVNKKIKHEGLL